MLEKAVFFSEYNEMNISGEPSKFLYKNNNFYYYHKLIQVIVFDSHEPVNFDVG